MTDVLEVDILPLLERQLLSVICSMESKGLTAMFILLNQITTKFKVFF